MGPHRAIRYLVETTHLWSRRRAAWRRARHRPSKPSFLACVEAATSALDPEEKIAAATQALHDEPHLGDWPLDMPRDQLRATLWIVLAGAYEDRSVGTWQENLELSIGAYERALRDLDSTRVPRLWAETQNNVGYLYWQRPGSERSANIESAIAAYTAALTVYDQESPEEWATLQNNLANAYSDRILGDRRDNLEQAIAAYEAALTVHTREAHPIDWAMIQNNLGTAYSERLAGDREENLDRALAAYGAALAVRTPEALPHEWATTQNNLGNAYKDRTRGSRADNLEQAISHYLAALTIHTSDAYPVDWATAQSNLGVAYAERIRGDWEENLERAIAAYEAALSATTCESFPVAWAETQNNLGIAYGKRVRGSRQENIERARAAFNAALTVHTRDAFPRDWALAQGNLGLVYQDRISGDREHNLEQALMAFQAALAVHTREADSREWARTQSNLGLVYVNRLRGDRASNLQLAIDALEVALAARPRESEPERWAATTTVLGLAHVRRADLSISDSLKLGIASFEAALTVRTIDAHPRDHLLTARLLASVQIRERNWSGARATFATARMAFRQLFGEGLNEIEACDLLVEAGPLYMEAAFAAAHCADFDEALALANEGKARLLAVALRLSNLDVSADDRARLIVLRQDIRAQSRALDAAKSDTRSEILDRLIALRCELRSLVEKAVPGEFADISVPVLCKALLPQGGAVVVPIITEFGSKFLIVADAHKACSTDELERSGHPILTILDLPELTTAGLEEFLKGPRNDPALGGWLAAYNRNYEMNRLAAEIGLLTNASAQHDELVELYARLDKDWRAAIEGLGPALWRLFAGRLWHALQQQGLTAGQRIVWLPAGAIGLLPLGLAEEASTGHRFADRYEIAYAPSLTAMMQAAREVQDAKAAALASVINPTGDLDFADMEGALVSGHFAVETTSSVDSKSATAPGVLSALRGKTHWHFATHGTFAWRDPRESALLLAGGKRITIGDFLEAPNLGRPRLVVLSACETALYDIRRTPDEFLGWPASFMSLGTAGVLSTLWLVDDRATMLLIGKFYDLHMQQGLSPPAALQRAQSWLRTASKAELVDYARAKTKSGWITPKQFSRLDSLFRRGDLRVRSGTLIAWVQKILVSRVQPTDVAPCEPMHDEPPPPFAHPYFWGAFIHTGL